LSTDKLDGDNATLIGLIEAAKVSDKKSKYEILEVEPDASLEQIKAAHRRLSFKVMSDQLTVGREACERQLNLLDVALHTLSNPVLREAYDAELAGAAQSSGSAVVPVRSGPSSPAEQIRALALMAEMEGNYKIAIRSGDQDAASMLRTASSTLGASAQSLKVIMRVVLGLFVLLMVLMMGRCTGAARQNDVAMADKLRAEEKLIILEYYKKYGVRPASRAEAEFFEAENRRKENALRAAEFEEKKRQEEYDKFIEDSRRLGDQAHQEVIQYQRDQARAEREKQAQEERAREEDRARLQRELDRYRSY
jgi:curved DNA-binding protein CbpA